MHLHQRDVVWLDNGRQIVVVLRMVVVLRSLIHVLRVGEGHHASADNYGHATEEENVRVRIQIHGTTDVWDQTVFFFGGGREENRQITPAAQGEPAGSVRLFLTKIPAARSLN